MSNLIVEALRRRYPADSHALLTEVGDGTASRYADALVVGLWRSHGFQIEGFEFKTSRADWLRELKNPAKSDPIFKFCDRFWLVTVGQIAELGEIPPDWGTARACR